MRRYHYELYSDGDSRNSTCNPRSHSPTLIFDALGMPFEFVTRVSFTSNIVHSRSCDGNMNDYMHLSVRLLEVMGVFETVETKSSLIWSLKILVFISPTLIFFVGLVNELCYATNDMSVFNEILVMVLFGTMCLVKYAALLYFRERMKGLKDQINDDMINEDKSNVDDLLIEHYDREGFGFAKIVAKMLCCLATMVFVQNFAGQFERKKLLIFAHDCTSSLHLQIFISEANVSCPS